MQEYLDKAMEWLAVNGVRFAVQVLVSLVILLVAGVVIRGFREILSKALAKSKRMSELVRQFLVNVAGKLLWVLVWLLVLAQLGVDIGPLVAGVAVGGFIVGFAFQDTLSNFAAGLMLLINEPFQVGDYVEVGGTAGSVKELNIMAVTLHTPDNRKVMLPNKVAWGAPITNYTSTGTRRVDMKIGISYSSDINKAKQIVSDLLAADERVLADPKPVVEVVEMADSSVNLVVRPWVKTSDYWAVLFAMHQRIKEGFDAGGIEIPFPQRVVHMADKGA